MDGEEDASGGFGDRFYAKVLKKSLRRISGFRDFLYLAAKASHTVKLHPFHHGKQVYPTCSLQRPRVMLLYYI